MELPGIPTSQGFSCSSVDKESACNTGDLGSIPGLGWFPGEGNGNPLQYSCLENPTDRGAWPATVHGVARVRHDWATKLPPPTTSQNTLEKEEALGRGAHTPQLQNLLQKNNNQKILILALGYMYRSMGQN